MEGDEKMEAEKREEDLQNLFIRLTHLYFKKAFALVKDTGIHPKQVPLIGLVYCREGISQKEISQALRISPPTVAVSIKRLEKAGIIERPAHGKDQRLSRIFLTEKGRAVTGKVRECIKEKEKALFKGFSESEVCLLRRFFLQMIQNLEEDDNEKDIERHNKG